MRCREAVCTRRCAAPVGRKGAEAEQRIVEQIRRAQRKHRGRYGRPRMTPEVSEALGRSFNHKRIGRLMREHGLCSRKPRPFRVVTTDSKHDHPIAPNVLERDFATTAPNHRIYWLQQHRAQAFFPRVRAAGAVRAPLARPGGKLCAGLTAVSALSTAGRFPVRRKRPNRPSVDNDSRRPWCPHHGVRFNAIFTPSP